MSDSHTSTPAKPKALTVPKKAARVVPIFDAAGLENKIRERAHQLYVRSWL
jgi:hypothetical protein